MAQVPQQQIPRPLVSDPDNVPETVCDGQFNLSVSGQLATLTFTHVRPNATQLFQGAVNPGAIVRARIVLTVQNLVALRDLLSANVQTVVSDKTPAPATGGTTKH